MRMEEFTSSARASGGREKAASRTLALGWAAGPALAPLHGFVFSRARSFRRCAGPSLGEFCRRARGFCCGTRRWHGPESSRSPSGVGWLLGVFGISRGTRAGAKIARSRRVRGRASRRRARATATEFCGMAKMLTEFHCERQTCRRRGRARLASDALRRAELAIAQAARPITGWVQWAQRRASMGISLRHSGHFFVVGSGGFSPRFMRATSALTGSTTKK